MFLQHNIILNIYYTTCWPLEKFDSSGQYVLLAITFKNNYYNKLNMEYNIYLEAYVKLSRLKLKENNL